MSKEVEEKEPEMKKKIMPIRRDRFPSLEAYRIFLGKQPEVKKIVVPITRDRFASQEVYRAFMDGKRGWDWHYNLTRKVWGYGSDAMDWHNFGEEWIDSSQILDIEGIHSWEDAIIRYHDFGL